MIEMQRLPQVWTNSGGLFRARLGLLLTFLCLGACGDTFQPLPTPAPGLPGGPRASPVLLSSRPSSTHSGLAGVISYDAVSSSGNIVLTPMTGAAKQTMSIGGDGVILAFTRDIGGIPYLFLGVNDASDVFHLKSVHDADADGLLDPSTLSTHFSTWPSAAYFTRVAVVDSSWYFLDVRCQDIRVARDTNADGLPDQLQAVPFAQSATYPYLLKAKSIVSQQEGTVIAAPVELSAVSGHESGWAEYVDSDVNGLAESEVLESARSLAPFVLGHVYAGQAVVYLDPGRASGKTAQIWLLDANGDDDTRLGSAPLPLGTYTGVAVSPVLVQGDRVGIRFSDGAADQRRFEVGPAHPQIYVLDPIGIGRSEHSSIQLVGQGFESGMQVKLQTAAGTVYLMSATVTDHEHASALLPSLSSTDDGLASIGCVSPTSGDSPWSQYIGISP